MTVSIGTIEGTLTLKDNLSGVIDKAAGKLTAAGGKLSKIGSSISSVGATISTRITAPLLAMGGASVKFATDFESSFAGVRKTVDATEDEFAELSQGFRDLSKEIPISVNEINAIGEAAGQLGIKTENILSFTRVMADLGVATNLSSDQAATALARLANITGLPQTQFDRLGSTIVALGNNFATTESEIVEMGLRLAGAGTAVGMTEGQILALSTALTSVGINAEAGGSAFSKVIKDMASSVAVGGDAVKGFANVAGTTVSEFSRLFREDASQALTLFVEGLGRMTAEDKLKALDELGFSGIRVSDALIRTSGAGELLADTLDLQAVAWKENTALTKEAEQRYTTFDSRVKIFWNRLKDLGITLGGIIIPKLDKLLDIVSPLIGKFQNLSTRTQSVVLVVGGLAAALGPAILLLGNIATAAGALGITLGGVGTAIATVTRIILGPIGLVVAGGALLLSWDPVRELLHDLAINVLHRLRSIAETVITTLSRWWQQTEKGRVFLSNLAQVITRDVVGGIRGFIDGVKVSIERGGAWSVVIDTLSGVFKTLTWLLTGHITATWESIKAIKEWLSVGDRWFVLVETVKGAFVDLVGIIARLNPILGALIGKVAQWSSEAANMADQTNVTVSATERFTGAISDADFSVGQMDRAMERATGAVRDLGDKTEDTGAKATSAAGSMDFLSGKLDRVIDTTQGASSSILIMGGEITDTTLKTDKLSTASQLLSESNRKTSLTFAQGRELLFRLNREFDKGTISQSQFAEAARRIKSRVDEASRSMSVYANVVNKVAQFSQKVLDSDVGQAIQSFGQHSQQAANLVGELWGPGAQREVENWGKVVNEGFAAFQSFASGDIVGGVIHGLTAVKQAFDNLFPSTKTVEERIAILVQHFRDGEFTLEHWNRLTHDMIRTLEKVADEGWDASRAADIMNDSFNDFVDIAITMGEQGLHAIERLVNEAERAGVGLDVIQQRLRDTWTELSNVIAERNAFVIEQTNTLVDGLITMLGETGSVTRQEIEFAGTSIIQAFGQMLEAGVPVVDIVARLGDTFDLVNSQGQSMGLDLGEEFGNLGELFELLADEKIQRVIERLEGMTAAAEAAANMGLLTTEQFDAWQNRINVTFNRLIEGGASSEVALAALQGPLQSLFNASQQYGFQVDANTQKLLDMALAQGVVTDMGLTQEDILIRGFDKMIEALNRLIQALGGVPIALETWGRSADDLNDRMGNLGGRGVDIAEHIQNAWDKATDSINSNSRAAERARGNTPPSGGGGGNRDTGGGGGREPGSRPGFQGGSGRFIDFGGGETIDVHGKEQISTFSEGVSIAAMVGTAIENAMRVGGGDLTEELLREMLTELRANTRAFESASEEMVALKARVDTGR